MSLATLFNVPRTPQEIEYFLVANEAEHNEVTQAVLRQKQLYLITLPLRPVDRNDFAGWLVRHATMHQEMNDALKLGSNDLMVLDFGNSDQAAGWSWLHASEHRNWRIALGI